MAEASKRKKNEQPPWKAEEDEALIAYKAAHKDESWSDIASNLNIGRSKNSCWSRWTYYLNPEIKQGSLTNEEKDSIHQLHDQFKDEKNKWSKIASHLPGRTPKVVKNYWQTKWLKQRHEGQMSTQMATQAPTTSATHCSAIAKAEFDSYFDGTPELVNAPINSPPGTQ